MSTQDFNKLVEMAMSRPGLAAMRPVMEKELLHFDIFHALDRQGLLKHLVFQGGTSLRLCRGSDRYSEDLDFAGGTDFNAAQMEKIKECVEVHIGKRYGPSVTVKEPKESKGSDADTTNVKVAKWVIAVETSPENRSMPRQKIKLEIANVPPYTREIVPLSSNYDFLSGMNSVLVPTKSMAEILADKVVAFPTSLLEKDGALVAISSKRIRHRDIWDIAWLVGKRAELDSQMVADKIRDYGIADYPSLVTNALTKLSSIVNSKEFKGQMHRFLDSGTVGRTLAREGYLDGCFSE